jgi:hypothetical protein
MRKSVTATLAVLIATPASAADIGVAVEIPRLQVAEYHRPYVAIWIERADRSVAADLAVWYDVDMKNDEGEQWLKDLRQWWRRSGRNLDMPVDGVSSATRPVGRHRISFKEGSAPLGKLPAGQYRLVVEAVREVGGREVLEIPFSWPPHERGRLGAKGSHELGEVTIELEP